MSIKQNTAFLVAQTSKESASKVGDLGSIPGLGRSDGGEHGNPLQCSCLENSWTEEPSRLQSMGVQRVGHDWAESDRTERLSTAHSTYRVSTQEIFPKLTEKSRKLRNKQKQFRRSNIHCYIVGGYFLFFLSSGKIHQDVMSPSPTPQQLIQFCIK